MAFAHELSWSTSRDGTFAECRRRYYHDYYLSWTGWSERAPLQRRQAYLLKKMTRLPMLAGDLVHQAIERYYRARKSGREVTLEESRKWAIERLRDGYKTSRDGGWRERPSKLVHLAEHHYEEECVDESTPAAGRYGTRYRKRIEDCLQTFFTSAQLEAARTAEPASFLACEDLSTFPLFETKVYAVPDFAYRAPDGTVQVLDWKTGSEREQDRFQLAVYTEYAAAQWGVERDAVICKDVYLGDDRVVEQRFSNAEREQFLARIEASIQAMRKVHFSADRTVGQAQDFPQVSDGQERICGSCNYRELCDRA